MTDISKCNGTNCKIKHNCRRFMTPSTSVWQSYIQGPVTQDGERCDMLLSINREELENYRESE